MAPVTPELIASIIALGVGTAVGTFFAARHPVAAQPLEMENEEDMSIYVQEVLPLQEKQHPELVKRIREKARELAAGGREITTDDIHEAMPLPSGIDGRILGSAFHPRAAWRKTGYMPSRRKENHSRPVARWVLKPSQDAA